MEERDLWRRRSSPGMEVIVNHETLASAPCCPHGPTLLFVKVSQGQEQGRRFYACSACRDRKDCNFFQWENEKVSEVRRSAREEYNRSHQPSLSHKTYMKRFRDVLLLPLAARKFCQDCQQLLLREEWNEHLGHQVAADVSVTQLQRPSQLLYPLENKRANAQYLFATRSCRFLLELILLLGFRRVLSVGTPRYSQFYTDEEFCHYNMFNHHFFGGEAAREVCREFLQRDGGEGVIIVTDPPFGGLVEPLAFTFKKLISLWRMEPADSTQELAIFWIFPYFFESRILQFFPSFCMLDYQVDYDNHTLYKHGKSGRKQSPVRIFTNIPPRDIVLPAEEGYRFCPICQRYVSSENRHCEICNSCTSKDGRRWKHCFLCKKCVKPSWIHCSVCGRCTLLSHSCGSTGDGCFICGEEGHKHRSCPNHPTNSGTSQVKKSLHKKKSNKINRGTFKRKSEKSKSTTAASKKIKKSKRRKK
ncbi:rRNA N6-adenosine-methyltransferase ZCCHC4 isoform X2 [Rhinatrema bivittatum]|uniref:rRNA N6-adenosine-methyltransferase ZCCHC4 isoform X2 n=1 Tax=Rhinatrema bivittatum TaxID=194408 RepID=UPI00112C2876|nr:rRNA N6-adenosine-methyltransferase ZCCHC4 isoform X2 [Rhinatrema bivittatum]